MVEPLSADELARRHGWRYVLCEMPLRRISVWWQDRVMLPIGRWLLAKD